MKRFCRFNSFQILSHHRVISHATLTDVRELIEDQLETDVIPEQYVFLRSVGRCLAIVSNCSSSLLNLYCTARFQEAKSVGLLLDILPVRASSVI